MPGRARQQAAQGVHGQLPALHAYVGVQRQPGIGRLGHADLEPQVLIDLQLRRQFAQQCGRHARAVVQRRAPLQLASRLQGAAYPAQLAICTPLAGTRRQRVPALRMTGDIQRCGVAMHGDQRIGELQHRACPCLIRCVPRNAGFDTQLSIAHHFILPPPHTRRFEYCTRGEQFHRPATQLFEQAQLQLALPFDVQLTQRHGLHLLGNDAVELQGPGG